MGVKFFLLNIYTVSVMNRPIMAKKIHSCSSKRL